VKALAALLLTLAAASVAAQTWPSRPVRIVVPYPPGGTVDVVARTLAQQLSTQVGQQFVIENRAGASGTLGSEAVAKSVPDGYTLLCNASIFVINPFIMERVPFDVVKDFTAIVNIGQVPLLVAAHPALPAPSLKEFVALARAEPGRYSFATSGIGSAGHLTVEMLRREAGLQSMLIVPYKGTGPALTDLIGGQVHVMADPMPSSFPHVKAGRLKALAQTGKMRAPFLTDVPTVAESGFPGSRWCPGTACGGRRACRLRWRAPSQPKPPRPSRRRWCRSDSLRKASLPTVRARRPSSRTSRRRWRSTTRSCARRRSGRSLNPSSACAPG
jgi:tripartite-type tricarboxylate transporter receptor subunit TctC